MAKNYKEILERNFFAVVASIVVATVSFTRRVLHYGVYQTYELKKTMKEKEEKIAKLESKNNELKKEISRLNTIFRSSNNEISPKDITSLHDGTEKNSLSKNDGQLLSKHPLDIILHLSSPNGRRLKISEVQYQSVEPSKSTESMVSAGF
jgi:hypothetical protein